MARKGKRTSYKKPNPAALKKNAVVSLKSQPTETSADHLTATQYTDTKSSSVPSEASASEVVNGFLQKWSHWIAWIGVVGAVIFTYSIFNNDISNTKNSVVDLKQEIQESRKRILSVEQATLKNTVTIDHLSSAIEEVQDQASQTRRDLKRIEIMQVKQQNDSGKDNTLTSPSSDKVADAPFPLKGGIRATQ